MKVIYNKINAIVSFEHADGKRARLEPRNSPNDHMVIQDEEVELPSVVGLLKNRKVTVMSVEQSSQFETKRGRKVTEATAPPPASKKEPEEAPKIVEPPPEKKEVAPVVPAEEPEADATDDPADNADDTAKSSKGRKKKKSRS